MSGALRELLAIFDIKVESGELKEADKHVEGFSKKLGEIAKTVGEAFAVKEVYEFVESQIEAAAHVQDLSERLDVSATAISNWAFVMKGAGVDADSSARALGFLEKNLGEAAIKGGQAAAPFHLLGVRLKDAHGAARPLVDLLGDVAEGISKLPDQNQRASVAMELFGREGRALVPVLMKGREALTAMLEEAGELGNGLGDEFFENAKKAREESEKIGRVWQSLKERSLSALLPAVTELAKDVKEGSKRLLEHAKATQMVEYAVGALAVTIGVALVDALATATVMAWGILVPFAPLAIAIGLVTWLIGDLFALVKGNDSTLGKMAEDMEGIGGKAALIERMNDLWKEAKDDVTAVSYALGYLTGAMVAFFMVAAGLDAKGDVFTEIEKELGTVTVVVLDSAKAFEALSKAIRAVPDVWNSWSTKPINKAIDAVLDPILKNDRMLDPNSGFWGRPQKGRLQGGWGSDVTRYGVPQSAVDLWNEQHDRSGSAPRVSRPGGAPAPGFIGPVRPESPMITNLAPSIIGPPSMPGDQSGSAPRVVRVEQHVHSPVTVHSKSDTPRAVGEAAGAGVATGNEKAMNNALAAVVRK